MTTTIHQTIATELREIYQSRQYCAPISTRLPDNDVAGAYAIQDINTDHWLRAGRRLVGRKIGLTSRAVQEQLGVNQPDYGMLFADMCYADGETIPYENLQQPKIEGEVAFVLGQALDGDTLTIADVMAAVDYALPSFEIVGSRIKDWKIGIVDTIADNASSGMFVLGTEARKLSEFDLRLCGAVVEHKGEPVSTGAGAACLGNPLIAALWLARKMVEVGRPLRRGDIVLSGALGPMVNAQPGDAFTLRISGLGSVRALFSGTPP
ncbi:MAG: 2-keto-4-pentenoate hydratase [Gammaproteobacteria bacterium RIFCSPLOWO2_02_FULL_61_13]|nr:MAG: 2-keto-4-pentenoate hydratase [Gammaproteobacteria bacterium RIFCSPLOWO2_02_FULL_61_13]